MTGDYSRVAGDPRRAFAGVAMQQGRVALDADWNEQAAILDRRTRSEAVDAGGRRGVPAETPDGFRITPYRSAAGARGLAIGRGRMYVDGLQAENFGRAPFELDLALARADGRGGAGVLGELLGAGPVDYAAQPFWPAPDPLPPGDGPHLVYLDVWRREVGALEDPSLLEPALGGVDTTTRQQTVWQVRVLPDVGEATTCATPPGAVPGWAARTAPSGGRLTTRLAAAPPVDDPCLVPAAGGYRGLENQLYRVEIHDGGRPGAASFKWSRDNATVAAAVEAVVAADVLTLASTGRDALLRFGAGDWVEVTDERRELGQAAGALRQVRSVDHDSRRVVLSAALPADLLPTGLGQDTPAARRTRMRRWDQARQVRDSAGAPVVDLDAPGASGAIPVPAAGVAIALEAGIEVLFDTAPGGGPFRPGDHWCFAARSVNASVEALDRAPPRGAHHHYAPLALVRWPSDAVDQRSPMPPRAGRVEVCAAVHADAFGRRSPLAPGEDVPVGALGAGIDLLLRQEVAAASVNDGTLAVTAELPLAAGLPGAGYGAQPSIGYTPVVLPGQPALVGPGRLRWRTDGETTDALAALLARGVPRIGTARFDTAFETFDNGQAARWRAGAGNAVVQEGGGAPLPGAQPVLPMLAVHRHRLRDQPLFVSLTVAQPVGRTCGLVYDWRSPGDFSVFYGTHQWQPVGFSGAVSIVRMGLVVVKGGVPQAAQERDVVAGQSDPAGYTLDLRAGAGRLIHGCSVLLTSGQQVARADLDLQAAPLALDTRLGVADRRGAAGQATRVPSFTRLVAIAGDRPPDVLIPLAAAPRLLARLVLRRSLLALAEPGAFPPPVPEADYETWFWLTPDTGPYGYGYGGGWQGVGAGLLLRG